MKLGGFEIAVVPSGCTTLDIGAYLAPHTEEITNPISGKQVRFVSLDQWTWVPNPVLQALNDRVAELEADARIKAANANPGEPVEFKGLNGETIVARMVR